MTNMSFEDFCNAARAYGRHMNASAISWGRTPKHTKDITAPGSKAFHGDPHEAWFGVDYLYDEVPPVEEAVAFASSVGLKLLREGHKNGDHVQPLDWIND